MNGIHALFLVLIALQFPAMAAPSAAPSWNFTKIADSSSTLPAPTATEPWSFGEPAVDFPSVAFTAKHYLQSPAGFHGGVYLWDGAAFRSIADNRTLKPDGSTFKTIYWDAYGDLTLSSNNVAFSSMDGAFARINGDLIELSDPAFIFDRMRIQGDAIYGVKVSNGRAFSLARYQEGSFTDIAPLHDGDQFMDTTITVDYGMIIPFGSHFAASANIFDPATSTTFNRWLALFINDGGQTTPGSVLTTGNASSSGPFASYAISYDGDRVSSLRYDSRAILEFNGSEWSVLVDTNTVVPGRSVKFGSFVTMCRSRGATAFHAAFGGNQQGIFIARGNVIEEIAATDKSLNNQTFEAFRFGSSGFDGASIALIAQGPVAPYSQTIYMGTPTPPALSVTRELNVLRLTWPAVVGAVYSIQSTDTLGNNAPWQEITTLAPSASVASVDIVVTENIFVRVTRLP